MTYSSKNAFISCGFGIFVRFDWLSVCSSSFIISLQMSMHSLQTYTPGPAISLRTSFCDLPQNEQQSNSSGLRKFVIRSVISVSEVPEVSDVKGCFLHFPVVPDSPNFPDYFSLCSITSSTKAYSFACTGNIVRSRSTAISTCSNDWPL